MQTSALELGNLIQGFKLSCQTECKRPRTVYRYFADWKRLRHHLELDYRMMRTVRKSNRDFSQKTVDLLSTCLEMPEEELVERLEKPWGLRQLLKMKA